MKKLLIAILAASVLAVGAQSGNDLFQKALLMERTEGNLPEAIKLYQRIVDKYAGDRKLAAQALMQMAQCYEKLGQAEARKTYERLVRDYADQTEQVEMARAKLAALGESRSKVAGSAMAVRRIWSGPEVDVSGAVSPDGRYLSFADSETGDLAIRDLETGKNRRLTNNGKDSRAFAWGSTWSPDGRQIVYDWYDGRVGKNGWLMSDLRIMSLKTAESRLLYRSRDGEEVNTYDWSPDGKYILAEVTKFDRSSNMALISVADGSVRVLKTQGWSHARFSPDGRYIAGGRPPRKGIMEQDVLLLSLADGLETPLVEHPADDFMLGWSPDGNWVLFASDRSGAFGVWAIQVAGGKARGVPQLIKLDMPRITPMGVTRNGSLYYGHAPLATDVYVAKLDPGTGKIIGPPELAVQRFEGLSAAPAYSPDGRYLAYVCAKGPMNYMASPTQNILRVRSLETGAEREFCTELYGIDTPRWFSDCGAILLAGHHDSRIYKVDTQTGQITAILRDTPGVIVRDHDISADGKAFYYVRVEREKDLCQILLRNLENGEEKELYRAPAAEQFRISRSPDGKWLAFLNRTDNRVLRIIPANGGEPRELFRFEQKGNWLITISWTADGKYILFSRPDSDDAKRALWRVPVSGGKPEKMGIEKECESVSAHPDGHLLAFSLGEESTNEVWVMENFLPGLKAAR